MFKSRLTLLALLVAGLAGTGSASAQIKTWSLSDTVTPSNCGQSVAGTTVSGATNIGNTWGCADQSANSGPPYNLSVTAWAATSTTIGGQNNTGTASNTFAKAAVINHGAGLGLGVGNVSEGGQNASGASPNYDHAMDNTVSTDMLLLNFTTSQVLRSVTIGFSGGDGDYQVLRWTGAGSVTDVSGKTAAQLLSDGWALAAGGSVDGAGNISTPDITTDVNTDLKSSSSWLITAFNSSFGGGGSVGADAVKVLAVTAGVAVPEPGSIALVGIAMLGGLAASRRRAAGR